VGRFLVTVDAVVGRSELPIAILEVVEQTAVPGFARLEANFEA
jgi:hypothetical protein